MSRQILYYLVQALFIMKVSSQSQSVKQYLLTRVGPQGQPTIAKIPAFNPINQPNIPNSVPTPQYIVPGPIPTSQYVGPQIQTSQFQPGLPISQPQFSVANSVASPMPCPNAPKAVAPAPAKSLLPTPPLTSTEVPTNTPMDTHVLNNLAIALQLLIVNNILNKPLPEPKIGENSPFDALRSLVSQDNPIPIQFPNEYSSVSYNHFTPMPSANFLGGSTFGDSSQMFTMPGVRSPTRSSMTLMSPYEALSKSPFSDPIMSPYGSANVDFQSPYAAILADNNDLFAMTDFF